MSNMTPRHLVLITPNDTTKIAFDALRVYSAAGCVVRVTPYEATNDSDTEDLTFPAGTFIEPCAVRLVWTTGTTGTPVIHGYR